VPRLQLPEKLLPFVAKPKRFKVAIGGRGSGKSMSIADLCLMDAQTKGIKTACFREFQVSIDDSVHSLLVGEIDRLGLAGFEVQNTQILYEGQEAFKFRGLARNPEGIKSMHGFKRFWVEEAQTISADSLKALTPTLRTDDSEIWFSANPRSIADPFSQRFIKPFEKQLRSDGYYEDDLHLIVWINYSDNPFFPAVLEQERAYDQANLSIALYRHIWLGDFYDEVEDTIIPVDWFEAAIDSHLKLGWKPEGAIIASHDPSDQGGDTKGYAVRHGNVVLNVTEKVTGDSNEGMDWALETALKDRADYFVWDCDGLGVSLKRQVDTALNGKKIDYVMFKGSESPDDPDVPYVDGGTQRAKSNRETFANKRAQYWWRLRDRFEATYRAVTKGQYINPDELISLSSGIEKLDQLRAEVCRIPLKRNNSGKIQIMSKVEMAKKPYEIPSPNMGDALMMAMYRPKPKLAEVKQIKFKGWSNG
jgi:phage terminase large subunit